MSEEKEKSEKYETFSATEMLKKKTVEFVLAVCQNAKEKQEPVSEENYETGFVRGVQICKSLLWRWTPDEIKKSIRELYTALDKKIEEIEAGNLSQSNKNLNKQTIADQVSLQVLELLIVVLQFSPMSTEFISMDVFSSYQDLINSIRTEKKVKLFPGE